MQKKVILITGASSGMGKITAKDLIKQGHIVYCAARHIEKMQDLEEAGGHLLSVDVTKDDDLQKAVETIINEHERIDILWNNAGFGLYGPVEEIPLEKARNQFETNLFGLARLTQMVTPHMRNKQKGLIINTSSMGGKIYTPLGAWYHASKHAVEGFSDCLRIELKSFGINVVILEPGLIDTHFYNEVENNVPETTIKGPYKNTLNGLTNGSLSKAKRSPAKVISKTITKIINKKNPKPRYTAGNMAKSLIFIRKFLGDRFFDKIMINSLK
ncbi:SDR family NAD(P)-dependent oxidoreductase [Candidatus Peregrinibacteria bacterium]|nr:SDR family NAD(P)-dependent oxidoreductase [Candidatus Peregrinibacteria bacterium]